jgi:hypothetical protein
VAPASADASPEDGGGVPPVNDLCAGAIPIPCGNINLSGHTEFAANDYTFTDSLTSCTGYYEDGKDVVYSFAAQAGDSVWLKLWSTADAAMYIVTDCSDIQGTCVRGADAVQPNQIEQLSYTFPTTATYYLIIDSYGQDTSGPWTLVGQFISCGLYPPANDRCEIGFPLLCGPFAFSGSTLTAFDDYNFPSAGASCVNSTARGRDVAFRLDVTAGDSVYAIYNNTANGAMYIVLNCADVPNSCIYSVNESGTGESEVLSFRFQFTGTYYLILDSTGEDDYGSWSMFGEVVCGLAPPANDRCDGATTLYCGSFSLSGSTELAINNYDLPDDTSSCTGFATSGGDVVYRMDVSAGDSIWVEYRSTADGSIYIVTNCDSVTQTCVYGVDQDVQGETERLRYRFPSGGTYYMILDSYASGVPGEWTMVGGRICNGLDAPTAPDGDRVAFGEFRPNPFRGASAVRFSLPGRGRATIRVYDLGGRVVRTLADGEFAAGEHVVTWDARDDGGQSVRPGMYFARMTTREGTALRKMLFVQ